MKKFSHLLIFALVLITACQTANVPAGSTSAPKPAAQEQSNKAATLVPGTTSAPMAGSTIPASSSSESTNANSPYSDIIGLVNKTQGKPGSQGGIIVSSGGMLELIEGDARLDNGFVMIAGQIANHSTKWARTIRMDITLYDQNGNVIFNDKAISAAGRVAPGTVTPFKYIRDEKKIQGTVAGYSISASAVESTPQPVLAVQGLNAVKGANGDFNVTGTIINQGSEACANPQIALVGKQSNGKIYDISGIVLMNGSDFLTSLAAGARNEFTGILDSAGRINSVEVVGGCD